MTTRRTIAVAGLAVVGAGLIALVYERSRSSGTPGPAGDPTGFYRAASAGSGPRGEVLATEAMSTPSGLPQGSRVWRVRYRTLDAAGRPVAASMAVAAPGGAAAAPRPVVAWVHGAVGVAPGCAPSRSGLDMPYARELLAAGVVVVSPDLTGLGVEGVPHPYLHGLSAGRAVLDGLRAAGAMPETSAGATVAVAGHSAGGHAALWANELAAGPDGDGLDLKVATAVAPIGDLATAMDFYATSRGNAAFPVLLFATWGGVEPVDATDALTPAALDHRDALDEQCLGGLLETFGGDPGRWVRPGAARTGEWAAVLAEQSAGRNAGAAPVVVFQGGADGSVLPAWSEALVADIRAAGGEAELRSYEAADHGGVIEAARSDIVIRLTSALG